MNKLLNDILESYQPEMIEQLQKIIRIKSVLTESEAGAPFGKGIQRALEYILELGRQKGFECINFENYACEINLGHGEESVGAVTHLDVVPEGSGWTVDPFGGEIIDHKIYGRGAVDDKGPLIAVFYACCAIKDSGLPLKKKIKHIIGTNEEKGAFPCIKYYKEHGPVPGCGFVPDAWFPAVFAEKGFLDYQFSGSYMGRTAAETDGILLLELKGGEALNIVAPEAKAVLKTDARGKQFILNILKVKAPEGILTEEEGELITITAKGKAAHASAPEIGDNAISKMLRFLKNISFAPHPLCAALHSLSDKAGNDHDGAGLGIKCRDYTGALTNNLGIMTYKDGAFSLKMNIRSPITAEPATITDKLNKAAGETGMKCVMLNYNPHFHMPEDHTLIRLLADVYREITGDTESVPIAHGGGSYARILDNFVPFGPSIIGEELCFHKQDEFIDSDRLLLLSKIYAEALYRLAVSR
jgi:succinyl-diaminopimelate desuccinylase